VDGNVSIRRRGETEFGVKAEVKNMNSFKALHDAMAYEIVRQAEEIEGGGTIVQETRHWDVAAKRTSSLRGKEEAHDYRYFPEPDMVPFEFTPEWIESVISSDFAMAEYFEACLTLGGAQRARQISNWMLGELSALLNAEGIDVSQTRVVPSMIVELVELLDDGTISSKQAKVVFAEMAETGDAPGAIVELKGMKQVSDSGAIEAVVDAVMAANPDKVEEYRGGKKGLMGFFVGQVMKEMRGQGNLNESPIASATMAARIIGSALPPVLGRSASPVLRSSAGEASSPAPVTTKLSVSWTSVLPATSTE
jgi:aspartyl-tRNA(Asn)/glutamyl-tRNA(Gln) amidotransferase subunit B